MKTYIIDMIDYKEPIDKRWFDNEIFNIENENYHRKKWLKPNYTHFWRKWCCFDCRVVGKLNEKYDNHYALASKKICYCCNKEMVCVGAKFKAPPKNNIKKWNMLKTQWQIQLPAYCNTVMAIECM
jgi:hypothetical protein